MAKLLPSVPQCALASSTHWGSLLFAGRRQCFGLLQSASQAIAGLMWGALADRTSRVRLLSLGCAGWGVVSIFLGSATSFWQFALLKVLNGIALARYNDGLRISVGLPNAFQKAKGGQ